MARAKKALAWARELRLELGLGLCPRLELRDKC